MMKRLRIVRSLHPRAAACERGSRRVIDTVAKAIPHLISKLKKPREAQASLGDDATAYFTYPYFLKVAFQSAAVASSAAWAVPSPPTTNG